MQKITRGIIYLITNLINEKKYVGLTTKDIHKRFKEHVRDSSKKCKYAIHRAIKKHGQSNFSIEVLEHCDTLEALKNAERHWIKSLNTHISSGRGYNMTEGGDGVLGYEFSNEHRKKLSQAHKGKIFTEKHRQNISKSKTGNKNPMFGKRLTQEHKEKISTSNMGRTASEETRNKISRALTGKKQSQKRSNCKPVVQLDPVTLTQVRIYDSLWAAARSVSNKPCAANIRDACLGTRAQAYGFKWKFAEPVISSEI